jgi:hypothetical protein
VLPSPSRGVIDDTTSSWIAVVADVFIPVSKIETGIEHPRARVLNPILAPPHAVAARVPTATLRVTGVQRSAPRITDAGGRQPQGPARRSPPESTTVSRRISDSVKAPTSG